MLAKLRPFYNIFVEPLGRASVSLGLSPDMWTIFSLITSILAGFALYQGKFWWGLALSLIMFAADIMDGATARASGTSSSFGMVFDHVVDRYAEFIIISGLMVGNWISPFVGMFASSGIVMASYVRAKAESTGKVSDCAVGIAGRLEKLVLTYSAIVLLGIGKSNWAVILLLGVGVISHITAIQRLLYAKTILSSSSLKTER